MRAALRGDRTPLLRLRARAAGLTGTATLVARGGPAVERDDGDSAPVHRHALRGDRVPVVTGGERRHPRGTGPRGRRVRCRPSAFAPFVARRPARRERPAAVRRLAGRPAPRSRPRGRCRPSRRSSSAGGADLRTPAEQARSAVASDPGRTRGRRRPRPGTRSSAATSAAASTTSSPRSRPGTASQLHAEGQPVRADAAPAAARCPALRGARRRCGRSSAVARDRSTTCAASSIGDAIAAGRSIVTGLAHRRAARRRRERPGRRRRRSQRVSYVPGVRVSGTYALNAATASRSSSSPARPPPAGALTIDGTGPSAACSAAHASGAHGRRALARRRTGRAGPARPALARPALRAVR